MKKVIPVLLLIFYTYSGFSQYKTRLVTHSTDPVVIQLVLEATKYLNGSEGYEKDYQQALEMLFQTAKEDEPVAQFLLGQMYENGKGVKVNLQKAYKYYKLSAENGEKAAMLQLGDFYKKGKGVELNFKNASKYFKKSSDKDSPRGNYALGYMHFKGLGVEQDYEKAYYLFVLGAKKHFPPAMFMLGICYEQGFYVEEDLQKAKDCYKYAASQNYKQAKVRLDALETGDNLKSVEIVQNSELHSNFEKSGLIPEIFETIDIRQENDILLNGEWEGELLIYDWSGNEIVETQTVKLTVDQEKYSIKTHWDSDMTHTRSNGFVQGNKVYFDKLNLVAEDAFGGYTHKNIGSFALTVSEQNGFVYLSGNISSTVPSEKEPGAPSFIILRQKAGSISSQLISASNKPEISEPLIENDLNFNVFPNPFDNKINIEFEVETAGNVSVYLYNSAGEKIRDIKAKQYYLPGNYNVGFELQVTAGAYVIGIEQDGIRQTRKLIKN